MKTLIIGLLLLLVSMPVSAQQDYPRDITLSWLWPTLNVDGTVIQEGDLRGGDAVCFRNNDFSVPIFDLQTLITVPLGARETMTFFNSIPKPGIYQCFVTAVTVQGISSDFSDEFPARFTGKPLPPQEFTAEPQKTATP